MWRTFIWLVHVIFQGVMSSMPFFYEKHKSQLRTIDQGADTVVWLAASKSALNNPSGEFFQGSVWRTRESILIFLSHSILDRKVVPQHLRLACTKSSDADVKAFMKMLEDYKNQFCHQATWTAQISTCDWSTNNFWFLIKYKCLSFCFSLCICKESLRKLK